MNYNNMYQHELSQKHNGKQKKASCISFYMRSGNAQNFNVYYSFTQRDRHSKAC